MAFVVLREGFSPGSELKDSIREFIREEISPVYVPSEVHFVQKLPKTRSGKIMRRVLRAVVSGEEIGDLTTLEDEASVEEVKKAYEEFKALYEGGE